MSVAATTGVDELGLGYDDGLDASPSLREREGMNKSPSLGVAVVVVVVSLGVLLVGCKGEEKVGVPSTITTSSTTSVAPPDTPKTEVPQGLTRPEAKRLLAQRATFPKTAGTDTFGLGDGVWCQSPPKLYGDQQSYVERGLVTLTPGRESVGDNQCREAHGYHFDMELTPLGKKYALGNGPGLVDVKTCIEDLGEVTGIASDPNGMNATVEYVVAKRPTPFGDGRCSGQRTESVSFRRYDDGWRIVQ
jgi:hypothetical protein